MNRNFILKIFEGFSIERWNDLIRPFDLVEMDNAAERMILAYMIGKYEEKEGRRVDWEWLIYSSVFDLLRKIQLCDIKSPIQNLIRREYPQEYSKLNQWVCSKYSSLIEDKVFFENFASWMDDLGGTSLFAQSDSAEMKLAKRIFESAKKFSSFRELQMIKYVNEPARYEKIEKELEQSLVPYLDLKGMQLLVARQQPFEFIMRVEQLRFQTRWNQTPRVPATSVLGHCFFVAVLSILLSLESEKNTGVKMCSKRFYNNFFSALFHDLPESVTRDIISPVKNATEGLGEIVKNIEDKIVARELVPLMDQCYKDEVLYFTSDEFSNRIILNGSPLEVSFEQMNAEFNVDDFSPVDGKIVRLSDHYSALLEARLSIQYGITSAQLEGGRTNLEKSYEEKTSINGINASELFRA